MNIILGALSSWSSKMVMNAGRSLSVLFGSPRLAQTQRHNQPSNWTSIATDLRSQPRISLDRCCGKASLLMTKEGKVVIYGTYISSRSTGVHRIKGGSVEIN